MTLFRITYQIGRTLLFSYICYLNIKKQNLNWLNFNYTLIKKDV